jgi:hypothetical protein
MPNVVNLQEHRNRKAANPHKLIFSGGIKIYKMALSPYKFGAILLRTNKGVYEWDIMNEILQKFNDYKEGDI